MSNPVVHFEIQTKDAKRTQEFFANLFGWHVDTNKPMDYGFVDTHSEGQGINRGVHIYGRPCPGDLLRPSG